MLAFPLTFSSGLNILVSKGAAVRGVSDDLELGALVSSTREAPFLLTLTILCNILWKDTICRRERRQYYLMVPFERFLVSFFRIKQLQLMQIEPL